MLREQGGDGPKTDSAGDVQHWVVQLWSPPGSAQGPGRRLLCPKLGERVEPLGKGLKPREGTLNDTDKEEGSTQ